MLSTDCVESAIKIAKTSRLTAQSCSWLGRQDTICWCSTPTPHTHYCTNFVSVFVSVICGRDLILIPVFLKTNLPVCVQAAASWSPSLSVTFFPTTKHGCPPLLRWWRAQRWICYSGECWLTVVKLSNKIWLIKIGRIAAVPSLCVV